MTKADNFEIEVTIEDAILELGRIRSRTPAPSITSEEERARRTGALLLLDEMYRIWGIEAGFLEPHSESS